ncbi:hypothetical protein GIB67_031726, partial [Kingdonia uniflora]
MFQSPPLVHFVSKPDLTIRTKNITRWTDSITEYPYTMESMHTLKDTSRNRSFKIRDPKNKHNLPDLP